MFSINQKVVRGSEDERGAAVTKKLYLKKYNQEHKAELAAQRLGYRQEVKRKLLKEISSSYHLKVLKFTPAI